MRTIVTDRVTLSLCRSTEPCKNAWTDRDAVWLTGSSTSGQSNLTWGRIVATDGGFNRIRQVAPTCPPMRAHWRHLANTVELVLPLAHPNPQPKWQIDLFSHFCTAHGRSPYTSPSIPWFLGPILTNNPNAISVSSPVLAQMTTEWPYTVQWAGPSPPQNCPFPWGIWTLI